MKSREGVIFRNRIDKGMKYLLLAAASLAVFVIILIAYFIIEKGLPVFLENGVVNMLTGSEWNPTKYVYGILPMNVGTFYVTFLALFIGLPFVLATAIFLAEVADEKATKIIRPAIELLAGIPSVIYGLFGMVVVNDLMRSLQRGPLANILPGDYQIGYSVLSGALVLSIMILPR